MALKSSCQFPRIVHCPDFNQAIPKGMEFDFLENALDKAGENSESRGLCAVDWCWERERRMKKGFNLPMLRGRENDKAGGGGQLIVGMFDRNSMA